MALSVRTNLASIRAASQLNRTQGSLTSSLERISSGMRVNRAADDAAGLSVASRMESDNTSLKQAIRNANDGVSGSNRRRWIERDLQYPGSYA
jgi:flagellin